MAQTVDRGVPLSLRVLPPLQLFQSRHTYANRGVPLQNMGWRTDAACGVAGRSWGMFDPHSFAIGIFMGLALGGPCLIGVVRLLDWWEGRQTVPVPRRHIEPRPAVGGGARH
jgi:hypothetical protein